ncbi:MAG: response regulator transcription factor [Fimbriimonadaceae bacterium]|nr:response regulator transcription factor [Chitinophagales bacterium]
MKIVIIEDEKPAVEKLLIQLRKLETPVQVIQILSSVIESVQWLKINPQPDLILLDIELTDGSSLEIFKHIEINCPIIFTTAYDEYLQEALEHNSIDYLLKPIKQERLQAAIKKYVRLQEYFSANYAALTEQYYSRQLKKKDRFLVRKGIEFISVRLEDVAYFFSEHKVTFLTDANGQKYIIEKTLAELEQELDKNNFYRLNRKYLAQFSAIKKCRSHRKGKLLVELIPAVPEEIIVSQEGAAAFKEWLGK